MKGQTGLRKLTVNATPIRSNDPQGPKGVGGLILFLANIFEAVGLSRD
jgi:hypothetical protein